MLLLYLRTDAPVNSVLAAGDPGRVVVMGGPDQGRSSRKSCARGAGAC